MKRLLISILAIAMLPGCMSIRGIMIAAALPSAAAVETRVGANCIRATEAGQTPSAVPIYRVQNARDVFDATVSPLIPGASVSALERVRTRTDSVCPPLPVFAPPVPPGGE